MFENNLQSAWQIDDSEILGIQSIKDYLYIFQSSKISVFESISETMSLSLSEEIHLQNPIINYSCSQKYIGIITDNSVEVRSRNHWENVIYFLKNVNRNKKVKQISIREEQIIIQYTDQTKKSQKVLLQVVNLNQMKQFEISSHASEMILPGLQQHEHSEEDLNKRLDHRLITIETMGKVNDVYVYQTGKGSVESGIFIQLSNSKKKAYKIGELTSLSAGSVKCMYRHQAILQGCNFKPQYIVLITEWEDQKSIDMIVHEILPVEDSGRTKYRNRIKEKSQYMDEHQKQLKSLPLFEQLMKQIEEQEEEQAIHSELQANLFPLFKGQVYVNSFYKEGILYLCTQNQEMRVLLRKNIKFGQKIVQKVDKWNKLYPMAGVHQGRPIYMMNSLIQGSIIQDRETQKVHVEINPDGIITKNETRLSSSPKKSQANKYTYEVYFQKKQNVSNIESKTIRSESNGSQNKFNSRENQLETGKLIQNQHSEIRKSDQNNSIDLQERSQKSQTFIPVCDDRSTQIGLKVFSKYIQTNSLENTQNNSIQTDSQWLSDIEIQTEITFTSKNEDKGIQNCQIVQIDDLRSTSLGKDEGNKNKQVHQLNKKLENVQICTQGTMTDSDFLETFMFPDQKFMSEVLKTLSDFRIDFQQCLLSNINLLNKANSDAKSRNEETLSSIASQISKLGIGEQIKACLMPIVKENMKKIVDQTKTIFNNGLANVKMQSEQILVTQNTIKKLMEQQQQIVGQMRKSLIQMASLMKAKQIHSKAIVQSLRTEIIELKQLAKLIQQKLDTRNKKQQEMEENLLRGFEQLNALALALQKEGSSQKNQQKKQQHSHEIQQQHESSSSQEVSESDTQQQPSEQSRKLPSIQGSFVNSHSPSYIAYNMPPTYPQNLYNFPQNQPLPYYPSNFMQPIPFPGYHQPQQNSPQIGYPTNFMFTQPQNVKSQKRKKEKKK